MIRGVHARFQVQSATGRPGYPGSVRVPVALAPVAAPGYHRAMLPDIDLTIDLDTLTQLRYHDRGRGPSATYGDESYNASANRLFVQAAKLIQAAEGEAEVWRGLQLLTNARSRLETIVDGLPASGLAVKLISGQRVGTVSLADLGDAIETAAARARAQPPTPARVLSMAVSAATAIEIGWSSLLTLFWIAEAQIRMGDDEQAGKTLGVVLATAEVFLEWDNRPSSALTGAMAKTGGKNAGEALGVALATVKEIWNERIWNQENIPHSPPRTAGSSAKTGGKNAGEPFASRPFGIALATGEKIEVSIADYNNDRRRWDRYGDPDLVRKAMAQAGAGQIAGAFATARKIKDTVCSDRAFVGIVGTRVRMGHIEEAFATAEKIRDADCRAWALVGVAGAQARAGLIVEAVATAWRIEVAYGPWALVEIANALAETG